VKIHTPIYFMALFEYNLSVLLNLPRTPLPTVQNNILLTNICNQNIIGWDLFIKGYTSAYWHHTQLSISALNQYPPPPLKWDSSLVSLLLQLYSNIWGDRNSFLHGSAQKEDESKAMERIYNHIRQLYQHLPHLASHYPKIMAVPLVDQLCFHTTHLQW